MDSCILVGTVSNVSNVLESDLEAIRMSLSCFNRVKVFLVESDSSDSTIEILESLKSNIPDFDYVSLGNLKAKISDRIERIRFCRNEYVKYLRTYGSSELPDYVMVADLDGMNGKITQSAVQSCFVRDDWDGVFSNQLGGYYDILALRHPFWQPVDFNEELRWLRSLVIPIRSHYPYFYELIRLRISYDRARNLAIYRKMLRLNRNQPWIPVDSAFGGLAIYKTKIFLDYDYSIIDKSEVGISEHVTLHLKMRRNNLKLFINPAFVNANWNTYNVNRFFIVRQFRQMAWNSTFLVQALNLLRKLLKYFHSRLKF